MTADILQEKWVKGIAITTTILAVVAAIGSSRSAFYVARAQLLTAQEGSQWAYFQAKSIKQNIAETQRTQFEAASLGSMTPEQHAFYTKTIDEYAQTIKRYDTEKAEIKAQAESTNMDNVMSVKRGGQFSLSVVFAQIGIMLSSVGAMIKRREMWIGGLAIGVISIVYLANGFLLFLPF